MDNSRVYFALRQLANPTLTSLSASLSYMRALSQHGLQPGPSPSSNTAELDSHTLTLAVPPTAEIEQAMQVTKALLLRLKGSAEQHGAHTAVVSLAIDYHVSKERWQSRVAPYQGRKGTQWDRARPDSELEPYLQAQGIPYLYLAPAFQGYVSQTGRATHGELDAHMNATGSLLTASLIHDWLRQTNQVPW